MTKQRVYIGSNGDESGRPGSISLYAFDPAGGKLTLVSTHPNVINPSFIALTPDRRFLYCVNEGKTFAGQSGGGVSAFAVDPTNGSLAFLNSQPTHGVDPCYISLDHTGKYALVTNYSSGSVTVFPIRADGQLDPSSDLIQHSGHSVNPDRQEAAHAHSIITDPTGRFILVADLGMDQVLVYRLDTDAGKLIPHEFPVISAPPGAGPRHMAFHPNGRWFYVVNELSSSVSVYEYTAENGTFKAGQTVAALPKSFTEFTKAADLHISADGRFVYSSNRGHDSIAVFACDPDTGGLAAIQFMSTGGQTPRNFGFDLTGGYLFAANQDSDTVHIFRVDPELGTLAATGEVINVPTPMWIGASEGAV